MKIKIKRKLREMSSVGGGAIQGYAGSPLGTKEENEKFNKKEEEDSKLKGKRLEERYSTQSVRGAHVTKSVSGEEEHEGHVERSRHQGLKNVMESDLETTATLNKGKEDAEITNTHEPCPDTTTLNA